MRVANMATFPAREAKLERAVRRVADQVDLVNLCLNEFESVPSWAASISNLNAMIPASDLKDLGKFAFQVDPGDVVLLVDDDIDYPEDYVAKTVASWTAACAEVGVECVGGYHGTIYKRIDPIRMLKDLLRGRGVRWPIPGGVRTVHCFFDQLDRSRIVTQIGTGTAICHGGSLPSLAYMMGAQRRADVRFAHHCFDRRLPMIALPRAAGWMPASEADDSSIWSTYTRQLPPEFVAEIAEFAFAVPSRGRYLKETVAQ